MNNIVYPIFALIVGIVSLVVVFFIFTKNQKSH